ncbi:MAG: HesB/IscA family protein [Hyphomicrobiaceae bacterium]|jgi:iron-sulfur cluster assembly accessory protein
MSLPSVRLTDRAASRIAQIAAADGAAAVLRLSVEGGGCSGFQYRFDLPAEPTPDDTVVAQGSARLLVDAVSLPYLLGAEVDFVDDLIGAAFKVNNPNASSSCGCGTSFAV